MQHCGIDARTAVSYKRLGSMQHLNNCTSPDDRY